MAIEGFYDYSNYRKKHFLTHLSLMLLIVLFSLISCKGGKPDISEKVENGESATASYEEETHDSAQNDETPFHITNLIPFRFDGKYGLIDKNLNVRKNPVYLNVDMHDYCVISESEGNEYIVYDYDLNELYNSSDIYYVDMVSEKYCQLWVKSGLNSYVLLNLFNGETKILNDYDRLVPDNLESEKYYASSSLSAFVNKDFTTVAFPQIKFGGGGYPFREGKAVAYCYNLVFDPPYSVINESGEQIVTGISETGKYFSEGLLPVIMQDGESGYINEKGEFEIDCEFNVFYRGPKDEPRLGYLFYDGVAVVNKLDGEKYGWFLLDRNKFFMKIDEKYEPTSYKFKDGYLVLKSIDTENEKYIFINKKAEQVFDRSFCYAEDFVNGYAIVNYDGEDGVLDTDGNIYLSKDLLDGNKTVFANVMSSQ